MVLLLVLLVVTEKLIPLSSSFSLISYPSTAKRHLQEKKTIYDGALCVSLNQEQEVRNEPSQLVRRKYLNGDDCIRGGEQDDNPVARAAPIAGKKQNMSIAICGGGIAGMAFVLSLHDAGFHNIDIYESVSTISEVGVGINIQPSAVRELIELGLGEELSKTGIPTREIIYHHINGQEIFREPRGKAAGYKWPQYSIHRGKLLGILHAAVVERLGEERIHTGYKAIDCGQITTTGEGVDNNVSWATFKVIKDNENKKKEGNAGAASEREKEQNKTTKTIEADLIVGCDGVHSNIRKALTNEDAPRWTGIVMLRGLTKMKPFFTGCSMTIIGLIEREMVIYPISKEVEDEGESLVNWVALKQVGKEKVKSLQEKWSIEVENIDEAIKPFEHFQYDFIDVPNMIRSAEKVYQYPMIDRQPLDSWVYGNITLLGDAAHPMIPIGANGATQAIIDGRVLASELYHKKDISSALKAYDEKHREAVNNIVKANREESETTFLEIIHNHCPDMNCKEYNFNDILTEEDLKKISKTYKDVAGFNPETLNNRESYTVHVAEAIIEEM